MADEETDFEDRFSAAPVETPEEVVDPQVEKKKELLRLMATAQPAATPVAVRSVAVKPTEPVVIQSVAQPRPAEFTPTEPDEEVPVVDKPVVVQSATQPSRSAMFHPQVDDAIVKAANAYGIDVNMLRAVASIESNGNPNANADKPHKQYKGLFQIGTRGPKSEWATHGQGDVYDPEANAMAAARLMRDNADRFRKVMGYEPTPQQIYMMHQQGLGFYTAGKMTNISGNMPKEMAGDPRNWTHAGFEKMWGDKLQARMDRAAKGSGPPYLATEKIAEFLNKDPIALQEAKLSEGLTDTPVRAKQMAQLMTGTPIEQISNLAQLMNQNAGTGGSGGTGGGAIGGGTGVGANGRPRIYVWKKAEPPPGEDDPDATGGYGGSGGSGWPDKKPPDVLVDALSPTMMSTIMAYQGQQQPPLATAPSDMPVEPPKTFGQRALDVAARFSPTVRMAQYAYDSYKDPYKAKDDLVNATKGLGAGVQQIPTNLVGGLASFGAAGIGLLTGNEQLKQFASDTADKMEAWKESSQRRVGLDPTKPLPPAAEGGQFIGENISPTVMKTLFNMGVAGIVDKFAPQLKTAGENYPIPDILSPSSANATTMFGSPIGPKVTTINTPGGKVRMNDAQLSSLVYGGLLGMGLPMGVSHTTRVVRLAKENAHRLYGMSGGILDPRRTVPGMPGVEAASIPSDILKGGIVDKWRTLNEVAQRQARYNKGNNVGIDPVAADAVYQKSRIQTGAGAQNHVQNAITTGNMFADDFTFSVKNPFSKIHEFTQANPEFRDYLKAKAYSEYLTQNAVANTLPNRRQQPLPTTVEDRTRIWSASDARRQAVALENANPAFKQAYSAWQENLAETRRFVSDGATRVENPGRLANHAAQHPTLPIFSETTTAKRLIDRLAAGHDPIELTETSMRKSLLHQMDWDTELTYMQMSHRNAFNPQTGQVPFQKVSELRDFSPTALEEGAALRRRMDGQTVYFGADPFIVSLMNSGNIPMGAWGRHAAFFKSGFQATTTGPFAPYFAWTGTPRAIEQGWTTAPLGVKNATGRTILPAGPVAAVYGAAARLVPQMAEKWIIPATSWFEDHFNQTNMGQTLNPGQRKLFSQAMERAYHDSHYKFLLDHGAFSKDPLNFATETQRNISHITSTHPNPVMAPILRLMNNSSLAWMNYAFKPVKAVGRGVAAVGKGIYKGGQEIGSAMQESPNFGWTHKVTEFSTPTERPTIKGRPISNAEIAARYRAYTGDPTTRGYIWSEDLMGNQERLRFSGPGQRRAAAYKSMAEMAHGARNVTPWAGVLLQSPANTIQAMRDNPVKASLAFTASHVLPEMVSYIWNTYHGQEYIDYQMDNITPAEIYIGIPGEKPENGIRIPWYQEGYLTKAMTRNVAHQYMGRSLNNMWEDTQKALGGFMNVAALPPMPSWLTAMYGMQGMSSPEGWVGDTFKRKNNPYVAIGGKESALELTWRDFMPSIADMSIAAYQAGMTAPNWGAVPGAVASEVGHRMTQRAPILRDIIGWKPPVAGSTALGKQAYELEHVINDMTNRYRIWDKEATGFSAKPASKGGQAAIDPFIKSGPPTNDAGEIPKTGGGQPKSKNPLYNMFMEKMEETFVKDSPEKGGIGYKSLWKEYGKYTKLINDLRTVNDGNPQVHVEKMKKLPATQEWLKENKVDPFDYRQVRDFYNSRRNDVLKTILYTIKATEQKIDKLPSVRKMLGDEHFSIEMLDPNDPNPTEGLMTRMTRPLGGGTPLKPPQQKKPPV